MTNLKKSKSVVNVGIDVGKFELDVCIHEKQLHWQDTNTDEGIKRILKRLSHYQVEAWLSKPLGAMNLILPRLRTIRTCLCVSLSLSVYAAMQGR